MKKKKILEWAIIYSFWAILFGTIGTIMRVAGKSDAKIGAGVCFTMAGIAVIVGIFHTYGLYQRVRGREIEKEESRGNLKTIADIPAGVPFYCFGAIEWSPNSQFIIFNGSSHRHGTFSRWFMAPRDSWKCGFPVSASYRGTIMKDGNSLIPAP